MNAGWVKLRRGALDHVESGKLNLREFAVFTFLVLKADSSTGSELINSPVLQHWFPELHSDGAQRVLLSLEKERFIYRDHPQSKLKAYRYWINKYEATTGDNKLRRSNLSKVFETEDINDIIWEEVATDPATDPATRNKKSRSQDGKNATTKTTTAVDVCAQSVLSICAQSVPKEEAEDVSIGGSQGREIACAHSVPPICAVHNVPLTFVYGADPGWRVRGTGKKLDHTEVTAHLGALGYEWKSGEVYAGGKLIPFKDAVNKIEGQTA